MPPRTLSPEIFTMVITMESPSRIRCDSLRESTSITTSVYDQPDSVSMYTTMPSDGQAFLIACVFRPNVPIPFHGTATLSSFQAAGIRSIHDFINPRRCYHLVFEKSLAARSVKQNRIAVCFPNRCEIHRARPVQAEVHAARSAVSHQDSFIQRK